MTSFLFRVVCLVSPLFLLSSCMTIDSHITISSSGSAHSSVFMDMSKMVTLLAAFGTGSSDSNIDKDLCKDSNFQKGLSDGLDSPGAALDNLTCTTLGDYKARIEGDMDLTNRKGVLILSGVTIVDMLSMGETGRSPLGSDTASDGGSTAEDMGFSLSQSYILPGNIVYKEVGTLSGSSTIVLNLLDPKILSRRSALVIATTDGKSLTAREINAYKLQLRKYNRKIR